jgi:hypothetical protein
VTCNFGKPTAVAAPKIVVTQLAADLPVATPTVSGKTITVPGASWATTAWLITHADAYGIDSVGHGGKTWRRSNGWKADASSPTSGVVATLSS